MCVFFSRSTVSLQTGKIKIKQNKQWIKFIQIMRRVVAILYVTMHNHCVPQQQSAGRPQQSWSKANQVLPRASKIKRIKLDPAEGSWNSRDLTVPSNPECCAFCPKRHLTLYFVVAPLYSLPCLIFCLKKNVTNLHAMKIRNIFRKNEIPCPRLPAAVRRCVIFFIFCLI